MFWLRNGAPLSWRTIEKKWSLKRFLEKVGFFSKYCEDCSMLDCSVWLAELFFFSILLFNAFLGEILLWFSHFLNCFSWFWFIFAFPNPNFICQWKYNVSSGALQCLSLLSPLLFSECSPFAGWFNYIVSKLIGTFNENDCTLSVVMASSVHICSQFMKIIIHVEKPRHNLSIQRFNFPPVKQNSVNHCHLGFRRTNNVTMLCMQF